MSLILGRALKERWRARYAWSAERGGPGLEIRRFRRVLELEEKPSSLVVYVSADSRYRLWVNGTLAGRGPLKGTLDHYYYEAYELGPYLHGGKNVIAAEVRWFGVNAPISEVHSDRPGFLFQGPLLSALDTPGEWKVQVDRSTSPDTSPYIANAHRFLGYWEQVDAGQVPRGWKDPGFRDTDWEIAVDAGPADVSDRWGESHPRQTLFPREAPMPTEEPKRFVRTWRDGEDFAHLFDEHRVGWALKAGQGGELILDAGSLTTGYPELTFAGGQGRTVRIIYGECALSEEVEEGQAKPSKGIRDYLDGGSVEGYQDTLLLAGDSFCFEPFHWRAFWFIKIVVSPGETPFSLCDARYRFTTYPQTLRAGFDADLPDVRRMWEVSWRTLQLCAHETYEDCPYYEQLNTIADSRIQALCSMVLAGEHALPRRTIRLFRDSVRPDGLLCSRVPSTVPQIMPTFCLIWVLMVEDYWWYVGAPDRDFVRANLHVVDGVLWFYRERLQENGFVDSIPPWNVVDRAPGWQDGTPPSIIDGESTYLTCLYIHALDAAARLHAEVGEPSDGERWRRLAEELRRSVRQHAWSEKEGLFLEGPGRFFDRVSQHSQAMAILSGAADDDQVERILERLTSDPNLHRMNYMQSFYLARALENADGYEAFDTHVLSLWRVALDQHLSTWPEYPDPTRSDCHAWGSWIAVDFVRCGLGIRPYRPGFQEILIAPRTEMCSSARGWAPTPAGRVTVDWRKDRGSGAIYFYASAPEGIPTRVKLPGADPRRYRNGGQIALVAKQGTGQGDAENGIELGTGDYLADLQRMG
jgi:hypothetical protein